MSSITLEHIKFMRLPHKFLVPYGQDDYCIWAASQAKPVKVVSYTSNPDLQKLINAFKHRVPVETGRCYYTAITLALHNPAIQVVFGQVRCIIPIGHAWNYYKGSHFDITSEITLAKHYAKQKKPYTPLAGYVQIYRTKMAGDMRDAILDTEMATDYSYLGYKKYLKRKNKNGTASHKPVSSFLGD